MLIKIVKQLQNSDKIFIENFDPKGEKRMKKCLRMVNTSDPVIQSQKGKQILDHHRRSLKMSINLLMKLSIWSVLVFCYSFHYFCVCFILSSYSWFLATFEQVVVLVSSAQSIRFGCWPRVTTQFWGRPPMWGVGPWLKGWTPNH